MQCKARMSFFDAKVFNFTRQTQNKEELLCSKK
nr:MAG TPA: hypothetical protein [Caudoviricetes sp.]